MGWEYASEHSAQWPYYTIPMCICIIQCMAVNPRESAHKTAVTFGTRAPRKLPDTSENK